MKTLLFSSIVLMQFAFTLYAQPKSVSKVNESCWNAQSLKTLKIQHKHGTLRVVGWEKDSVWLKSEIVVEHHHAKTTEEIVKEIQVGSQVQAHTLQFTTRFSEDFHSNYPFLIHFVVYVPAHLKLEIDQTLGKIELLNLPNPVELKAEYSDLNEQAAPHTAPRKFRLNYSKAQLEGQQELNLVIKHSTVKLSNVSRLKLDAEFGIVNLNQIGQMESTAIESNVEINRVDQIKITGSNLFLRCSDLMIKGWFEIERGEQSIGLSKSCSQLNVANKNTRLTIQIPEAYNFTLHSILKKSKLTHAFGNRMAQLSDAQMTEYTLLPIRPEEKSGNLQIFNTIQNTTIQTR